MSAKRFAGTEAPRPGARHFNLGLSSVRTYPLRTDCSRCIGFGGRAPTADSLAYFDRDMYESRKGWPELPPLPHFKHISLCAAGSRRLAASNIPLERDQVTYGHAQHRADNYTQKHDIE